MKFCFFGARKRTAFESKKSLFNSVDKVPPNSASTLGQIQNKRQSISPQETVELCCFDCIKAPRSHPLGKIFLNIKNLFEFYSFLTDFFFSCRSHRTGIQCLFFVCFFGGYLI